MDGRISVVVPTGGAGHVQRAKVCLRSIQRQSYKSSEIIITCFDPEGQQTPLNCPGARVIRRSYAGRYPPPEARNVGIKATSGDVIALVDSDSVLHPHTFEVAIELMRKKRGFVRVAAWMFRNKSGSPVYEISDPETFSLKKPKRRSALGPGGVLLAPRGEVFRIHGWDESYEGYGIADWDFVKRLEKTGLHHHELPDERYGVFAMHQFHERERAVQEVECRKVNRVIYEKMLKDPDPVRNRLGWGEF